MGEDVIKVDYLNDATEASEVETPRAVHSGQTWGRWTWDGLALVGNFPKGQEKRYVHVMHLTEETKDWIQKLAVRDDVEPADVVNFYRALDALNESGYVDIFERENDGTLKALHPKPASRLTENEARLAELFGLTEDEVIRAREVKA